MPFSGIIVQYVPYICIIKDHSFAIFLLKRETAKVNSCHHLFNTENCQKLWNYCLP